MENLVEFKLTKKAIYRAAEQEMDQMFHLSYGGGDPIASEESRAMFESGVTDEVKWVDRRSYCNGVVNKIFLWDEDGG